jgi:S-adenosylmethionine-diacylgycerolhomoserine-N-methlytransferase
VGLAADLKILYHLAAKPVRGDSHADRLESFYAGQAAGYDDFRRRLLPGRSELFSALTPPQGGIWVDVGGGTAQNLEHLGDRVHLPRKIFVVDLAPSLLAIATKRIQQNGWTNVETLEADATDFQAPDQPLDVVTFSYSLTMIPDWFRAIRQAWKLLRPGGLVGVVDFYVSRKHPKENYRRHSWWTRTFWPIWFARDNVYLSPDHVAFLHELFQVVRFDEGCAKLPYLPLAKVPYYLFLGRKR